MLCCFKVVFLSHVQPLCIPPYLNDFVFFIYFNKRTPNVALLKIGLDGLDILETKVTAGN